MFFVFVFFFFKQKTAYEMRISDWSSDVCSSDLLFALLVIFGLQASMSEAAIRDWGWRLPFLLGAVLAGAFQLLRDLMHETAEPAGDGEEIGRASCRERVCQYV